ncbi:transporter substrate-binding domain-containing protein [Alysiella crassa]|uniref:Glutamine ABC transporter periplasmic protein n=1 Tax=Alysiella crassa TaxID=153491 RepID=A0A376BSV6_9NEIS|nr:transporter substrate-binding domain-containing protein [Alysiella crassa]UOP08193.1 transporter substrate-binding domain-containing protein [Alysiella crassa]SSY79979.1 glutamine ABC transporter periplasmic protein [Alysiella crassa]
MKRFAITLLFGSLLLAACNADDTTSDTVSASQSSAVSIASMPVLTENLPTYNIRFANEPYPPFNILMPNNTFEGLETDILQAIAKKQGFKIYTQPYVWDVIFKDFKQSNSHMVGGGLASEDFDLSEIALSKAYMRSPDCVVATHAKKLQDWHKRKIITVSSDELDDSLIEDYQVKRRNIHNVRTQYQALGGLLNKQADVTISDCHVLKYHIYGTLKNQSFVIKELSIEPHDTSYDLVFGVHKDEKELLKKINAGIEQLKQSGEIDKIIKKWTTEQTNP